MPSRVMPWDEAGDVEICDVSVAEYEAARGSYMSSHLLELFRSSPRLCQWKLAGLLPSVDSPAYSFGRAVHTYLLEGPEVFGARYKVGDGPINEKTGKPFGKDSQKYADWYKEATKDGAEVIDSASLEVLQGMRDSLAETPDALEEFRSGEPEVTVRGFLAHGIECQSRLDWFDADGPVQRIVDLKTTENLDRFHRDFFSFGYDRQLAFYAMMIRAAYGRLPRVSVVAIEKRQPYRVGCWLITEETLETAKADVETSLRHFAALKEVSEPWPLSLRHGTLGML